MERADAWLRESKRLAFHCDRPGFIVEGLVQAVCAFLSAPSLAREL